MESVETWKHGQQIKTYISARFYQQAKRSNHPPQTHHFPYFARTPAFSKYRFLVFTDCVCEQIHHNPVSNGPLIMDRGQNSQTFTLKKQKLPS